MSSKKRTLLNNGLYVYEDTLRSASIIHHQVGEYFKQGLDVKPGMTVFDVGANIGVFGLEVLRRTGGDAKLFCLEPAPITFDCMRRALNEQYPDAQVEFLNVGAAATVGEATFLYRPRASVMSSFGNGYVLSENDFESMVATTASLRLPAEYERAVPLPVRWMPRSWRTVLIRLAMRHVIDKVVPSTCPLTTIDQVVYQHGVDVIDVLKVDVEGFEWEVLQGIGVSTWAIIQSVAIEVHDIDNRVEKTEALLRQKGFAHVQISQEDVFSGTSVYGILATR